ncbi:MAG: transposase, partial [Roseofilum sp. SBFL]|uniref:transposase n=2 Tax=Roseofilum TaxID=1233426 RepID=UPI001B2092C5
QKKLNNKKPLLSQLNELVPWEEFRPILEQIHDRERSSNAGRKPLDVILIFKLVILQNKYEVTDASVYDSKVLGKLIDIENADPEIWADSAYRSEEIEWTLSILGFESKIHEKGCRYRLLSEAQKLSHREKSRTRAKVEQVFGAWVMCMGGKLLRSIGKVRAEANIGLRNVVFNLLRYVFWSTADI